MTCECGHVMALKTPEIDPHLDYWFCPNCGTIFLKEESK